MNILDNKNTIKKYDTGRVLESLELLAAQISDTELALENFSLPADYKNVNKIILCGMGGSALGAQLLKTAFFDSIKVPFEIVNDYWVPGSLDNNTLYILSSYSGGTEEPLSTLEEAKRRGAKILGLTAAANAGQEGGKLEAALKKYGLPAFIFDTKNNPSRQPRLGLGYAAFALWGILAKLNFVASPDWKKVLTAAKSATKKFGFKTPVDTNRAKRLAKEIAGKIPVLVTHGFLNGSSHIFANQINETGKQFVARFTIPELNHHLMEGLQFPEENKKLLYFVFLESKIYPKRIQQRIEITKKVLAKNKIKSVSHEIKSNDVGSAITEALVFGSFTSFYMAMLNKVNPAGVPWVDLFKKELSKF